MKLKARARREIEIMKSELELETVKDLRLAYQTAHSREPRLNVFLCHSSGDKPEVRKFYKQLLKDGFQPWLDEEDLLAGQEWDSEIRKAVRSSHIIIVFLSSSSISKEGYVQKEIKLVLDAADEKPEGTIFLIPARLDECTLSHRFQRWHKVDLFKPDGYDKLLIALKKRASQLRGPGDLQQPKTISKHDLGADKTYLTLSNRGALRRDAGDLEGALKDLNQAIRLKPDYADAFYNRALARVDQGNLEGALQDFDEAIRLNPKADDAFNSRGNTRKDSGDLKGALQDHDEAIRLNPNDPAYFNNRGNTRKDSGDLKGALQDYDEAIRLKSDYAVYFYNRAIARVDKGDLEGALQDYDEAIRLNPNDPAYFNNRGALRRDMGNLEGALQDLNQAIHLVET